MSSSSPTPSPLAALTGCGSPRPSSKNSVACSARRAVSALLATSNAGLPERRSSAATSWSAAVIPAFASTTKSSSAASATADSTWARMASM